MAPVLTGVWWGPEAGVMGSGAAAANSVASWLGSGQLVLVVTLSTLTTLLLFSALLLLCAGCQGQKKVAEGHAAGDHENLVNGVSEKETVSQSAESLVTDGAVSSSHNGPATSGTILTDTQDTSPQPSEELLSSLSELRSSKCPQDRELPSIPPNNALIVNGPSASGDSTYEVVKEMVASSRDVSAEDSLYETVKELKEAPTDLCLSNGTTEPDSDDPPHPPVVLNGHLSPSTPDRGPLCDSVEYASVDLKKKSRHSLDVEAKRRSANAAVPAQNSSEEPEEDSPPPVPEKVLDENDNQPILLNGLAGAGLQNGEVPSPVSPSDFRNSVLSESESAVYSTVNKTNGSLAVNPEEKEPDYSSIAELKGLVPASSSSDLYATVRDIFTQPGEGLLGEGPAFDSTDPGYEAIRIPKTGSSEDDYRAGIGADGSDAAKAEPDYECVGEFGLSRETSRL